MAKSSEIKKQSTGERPHYLSMFLTAIFIPILMIFVFFNIISSQGILDEDMQFSQKYSLEKDLKGARTVLAHEVSLEYVEEGKYQQTVSELELLLQDFPEAPDILVALYKAYSLQGNSEQKNALMARIEKADPARISAL